MLHLLTQAFLSQAVADRVAAGDDVVLQAGTVWAAFSGHQDNAKLQQLQADHCQIYALNDSLSMNGIADNQLLSGIEVIDYAGLVELTVKNSVIHTWC